MADDTLASATAVNSIVGYDIAVEIVRRADRDQRRTDARLDLDDAALLFRR